MQDIIQRVLSDFKRTLIEHGNVPKFKHVTPRIKSLNNFNEKPRTSKRRRTS
jgi:hypothetical protein